MENNLNERDKEKERKVMEFLGIRNEKKKISMDERNRILDKTRRVMEMQNGERLTQNEEEILKEIAGVLFTAYKKTIEYLDEKELGGMEDEQEL